MGETQHVISLTQWRGISYGATNSTEDSSFTGDENSCEKCTPSCSSSCASHCLRKDGEYWYEAKTCFPCVLDPKDYFIRKVPFIKWLRRYSPSKFLSDVIAGMTVGLMVVPQALAYAKIAGLPLEVKHSRIHLQLHVNVPAHTTHLHTTTCMYVRTTQCSRHTRTHACKLTDIPQLHNRCAHIILSAFSPLTSGCSMAFILPSWVALSTFSWGLQKM